MTDRSDRGMHMIKISKKNMNNLYDMKGTLKLDAVRRAANRMIN
jgi:DNA-binding GntR family transcriptional regulator